MNPDLGDEPNRPPGRTPDALLQFLSQHRQSSRRRRERTRRLGKRRRTTAVLLGVVAALALVAVGVVIWRNVGNLRFVNHTPAVSSPQGTATGTPGTATTDLGKSTAAKSGHSGSTQSTPALPAATTTLPQQQAPQPAPITVRLTATRGDSWVEIRAGSRVGQVLFEGTIQQGKSISVRGHRLWARFGSLGNLDLIVNGQAVHPALRGTLDTVITASGIRPASARTG